MFDKDKLKEEVLSRHNEKAEGDGSVVLAEGEEGVVLPLPNTKSYDKSSSFFDTLSCEILDRMRQDQDAESNGARRRPAYADRRINVETFGQLSLNDRQGHRGHRGRRPYNSSNTSGAATGQRSRGSNRAEGNPQQGTRAQPAKRVFVPVQGGAAGDSKTAEEKQ